MSKSVAIDTALRGEVISLRVRSIIDHEAKADDLSAQSDEHRWEAARLIAEELEAGKTQRELAGQIGKSHSHVGRMARTWNLKVPGESRPFNEVYNSPEVRGTPTPKGLPKPKGKPAPPPGKKAPAPPAPRERSGEYIALAWQNIAQALGEVLNMGEPKWSPKVRHAVLAQLRAAVTELEKEQ